MKTNLELLYEIRDKLNSIQLGKQDTCSGGVVPDTQRVKNVRK